ncbi:MAG: hypothetical protein Ct9H300mP4_14600 [Gammaproteobacteria bacterium]|nr:MAG: hypothetical protein Ct9H300mP4_14600 [Gammaproteobacteria bacterium]
MEEKFPYDASMVVVTEDMCDLNGHMNVAYYLQAFDIYSRPMFEDFGFTKEHFKNGYSSFAVEDSIRYLKEFLLGEKIFPRFRLENFNKKLIHIVGILLNEEGQLASISETIIVHVDMRTRKTIEMPKSFQIKLQLLRNSITEQAS